VSEYYETVHTEARNGFDIVLSITPETERPDWDFNDEADEAETLRKIDAGVWLWFVARVQAFKNGILLGTDYLGGCCYESIEAFIAEGGYFDDMVDAATTEARKNIA